MVSAHQPTQEQINELEEKGRLILKEHSKDDGGISNCPNRQEIKELISDFRDVLKLRCCTIVQLGGSPLFLFRIIHPRGDE
jgi:hypothetical protein